MAVKVAQFEFTCNTSTGNQTIVSGLDFTPTGYLIWSNLTTSDATYQEQYDCFMGMSDGTTTASVSSSSQDDAATSNSAFNEDLTFTLIKGAATIAVDAIATHSSFGSGTIVINWSDAPSAAYKMHGVAFGGDIQCEVNRFELGTTTTGNKSYSTTMSNPEFGIFLYCDTTGTSPTFATGGITGLAFDLSSSKSGYLCNVLENARTQMDTWSIMDDTHAHGTLSRSAGSIRYTATFVSWNANGFTLNYDLAPSYTNMKFFTMVMKGANFDFGTIAKRTSTGDTVVNTASGVGTVKGVILASTNLQKNTAAQSHARLSLGAASSTSAQGGSWVGNTDSAANDIGAKRSEDSNILIMATEAATATSSTTNAIASISNMGTETFTLSYTTCDSTAADIFWVAIGETGGGGELKYGTINESPSISVSESLARVQIIQKSISDTPTVSVSESLARLQTLIKQISDTPTISVSESLEKVLAYPRPISNEPQVSIPAETLERIQYLIKQITTEPDVTIPLETIAKVAAYPRPIADTPTVDVSELLARLRSSPISIGETPAISVSELLAKSALFPRPISDTPTVSVGETLERIQTIIKAITNEPEITVSELIAGNFLISRLINESPSISVSETLERIQYLIKTISDTPEVTVSELLQGSVPVILRNISEPSVTTDPTTIERLATFLRPISDTPTVSVSETLARVQTLIKLITNEPEISISDVATTLALIARTLAEPSQSISEEITRIQYLIKLISEDTPPVSTNDTVTGLRALLVSILESRVKWYYSLLTRKIPEGEV